MSDLIKRNLAIAYATSGLVRRIDGEDWIRISEVKKSLNDVPTICGNDKRWCESCVSKGKCQATIPDGGQVVPDTLQGWRYERTQGEWIVEAESGIYICPFCNERHCCKMKFCGNCGASMRGKYE